MHTTLRTEGANCPFCFTDTLDSLGRVPGVQDAHGSIADGVIEIDHDAVTTEALVDVVRAHLHGVEMYANETVMVPLDPVEAATPCRHQLPG